MDSKIERSGPVTMSTNNTKISMLVKKPGFLIPKNKLSGSLIPAYRSGGKLESGIVATDEVIKTSRKTKWGPDLMQDPFVKKARALAYQTRVNQIAKHLEGAALEDELERGHQDSTKTNGDELSRQRESDEDGKSGQLELEMREAIGEILLLNPSYKAPPTYKPILKEAKIPVSKKYYSGDNFMYAFLGPGNNTLKRLEEETGAKIRVYGIAKGTGEKREVDRLLKRENGSDLEDIYFHVSADTYEKIDAAGALIGLSITPRNEAASADSSGRIENQDTSSGISLPPVDQVLLQQKIDLPQSINESIPLTLHQPHLNPWVTPRPLRHPILPTGFIPLDSGHISNVPPAHTPSYGHSSGTQSNVVAGHLSTGPETTAPHNIPFLPMRPHLPNQPFQGLTTVPLPQNSSIPGSRTSQQPLFSVGHSAPRPTVRPLNLPMMPDSSPKLSNGPSGGWAAAVTTPSFRPLSDIPTSQPLVPLERPLHPSSYPNISLNLVKNLPPNVGAALMPPVNRHLAPSNSTGPQLNAGLPVPRLTVPPDSFAMKSALGGPPIHPHSPMRFPPPPRPGISSHDMGQNHPRMQFPLPNPLPMVVRSQGFDIRQPHQSGISLRPGSGDFTFQPQSQLSVPQSQNMVGRPSGAPVGTSLSSFRPALDAMAQTRNHRQEQAYTSGPLHNQFGRPNFVAFPNAPVPSMQSAPQMGRPDPFSAPFRSNSRNSSVLASNVGSAPERSFHFRNTQPGNMAYDPFSPT